ncbi:MAG TPA: tripartite tricarboxylate transporter TctB family protein [Burkholderiales bacterium]|nr:tripartite tricarboxylate transporter TctB family protein [Burkholderiales bacterium]
MGVRIRSPRDFWAGVIFLSFGLCAVVVGRDYPVGTARQMGAGYFPMVLGGILTLLGVLVCLRSLLAAGEKPEAFGVRPLLLVLVAVGAFAASIDTIGLVAATVLLTVIGAAASPESRWHEVAAVVVVLLGVAVGVFVYGLGLPFKLLP